MMNSVTLPRQKKKKLDSGNAEVNYANEVDLHTHISLCDKNPGHQKFVPIDQFNVDHLPPGCHDNDLVNLVRVMSALTVRVSVKYVSEDRPETYPGSDMPYPSSAYRGRYKTRTGTGWILGVYLFPEFDLHYTNCPCQKCLQYSAPVTCDCQECLKSDEPKTQFAHILIQTAAHVVCDDMEAAHTACDLFFDTGGRPDSCEGVVTLSGLSDVWCDTDRDISQMRTVSHDLALVSKLHNVMDCWDRLRKNLDGKYNRPELPEPLKTLTIIVSHPHGCSKQISVGHYTERDEREDRRAMYMYTTSTCPGSSGATVLVVSRNLWYRYDGLVHCGNCDHNKGLNHSGYSIDQV